MTTQERDPQAQWARRWTTAKALVLARPDCPGLWRGAVEYGCRSGALQIITQTVCKWRQCSLTDRLDGLVDAPRAGASRTVFDDEVERLITQALETQPPQARPTGVSP